MPAGSREHLVRAARSEGTAAWRRVALSGKQSGQSIDFPICAHCRSSTGTVSLARRHLTSWTSINCHRLSCSWYRTEAAGGVHSTQPSHSLGLSAQPSGSVTSHGPTPTEHCRILTVTSTVASCLGLHSVNRHCSVAAAAVRHGASSTPYVATGQTGGLTLGVHRQHGAATCQSARWPYDGRRRRHGL